MKKFKKGFTITELVIVIAVIAILAAVLIPTFTTIIKRAEQSAALQEATATFHDQMVDPLSEGKDVTGMAFVNNGYVFVYLEGTLQQIGDQKELEDKTILKAYESSIDGILIDDDTLTDEDKQVVVSNGETLYAYEVDIDGVVYRGYFTYMANDAEHQSGNTVYSRLYGADKEALTLNITLPTPTEA